MAFLEPEAESRFDTTMVVGLASCFALAFTFLGLVLGMVVS
jgi:hypothetical protein